MIMSFTVMQILIYILIRGKNNITNDKYILYKFSYIEACLV